VTYTVSPALDHAVSTVSVPKGVDLGFHFDSAYWASGLRVRAPGLDPSNLGTIDATTFARGLPQILDVPEAGTLGQPEPYTMIGQRWLPLGEQPAANRFTVSLKNLSSATLDIARMGLSTGTPLTAAVTTDGPTRLVLRGAWGSVPAVKVTGARAWSESAGADWIALNLVPAGAISISIS
jgi:hypothetical protein